MALVQFPTLGIQGLLTAGRIPFAQGAISLKDSADLAWNNTTKTLTVNGLIRSSTNGFQFPDNTTQTTAFIPASYVPATRLIAAGTGLSGGGDLSADRTLSINQGFSPTWSGSHTFSNNVVLNGTPSLATHAVNKGYVDAAIQGLSPKAPARALASANVASLSGTTTIDGVALAAGQRVLLKGQTTASQNGLWVVASGAWTRPTDFSTGSSANGTYLFIEEGTVFADTAWLCTNDAGGDVVDTNSLTFVQFSGAGTYTAGTGLTLTGNVFSMPGVGAAGAKTFATGDSITTDAQGRVSASSTVTRTLTAGTGLTGGGTLAADRTFAVDLAFSPSWTGAHSWTTGTASFAANAARILNGAGTFYSQLATNATANRTVTFPDGNTTVVGQTNTQTLSNKTIDGGSNTLTNIANASLVNSSVTVTAGTGLSGGGAVALGASVTLSLPNVGPGAGTIGGGTSVVTSLTLDAQGRVTGATSGAPVSLGQRAVETQLTSTSATAVATYTPGSTKGLWVALYYRVVTGSTNVTITVDYTDVTGAQTITVLPTTSQAVGSYVMVPIFIVSTAAAVTVTYTAGTANRVFASASVVEA
jgi:hypothetical protein